MSLNFFSLSAPTPVLINKADLLPDAARQRWAAYFRGTGVRYAFWSAAAAQAQIEDEGGVPDDIEPEDLEEHRRRLLEKRLNERPLAAAGETNVVETVLDRKGLLDLILSLRPKYEPGEIPGTFAPGHGDIVSVSGARPSVVVGLVGLSGRRDRVGRVFFFFFFFKIFFLKKLTTFVIIIIITFALQNATPSPSLS
jgi:hypothetical protein